MAQKASGSLTITNITDGANANIWTTSTAPTTPNYTFTISNLTGADDNPRVGDIILQGVYRYTITSIGSTTVLAGSRQSLQGATGAAGGKWYSGTGITGTNTTAQIFSGSGVSSAVVGDMYLNTSTDNVYQCTTAGNTSTAKWKYVGNIKGSTGSQGRSVTSVVTEYYRKLSGGSAPTSSTTGSTTIPDYVDGCTYYTRTITNFDSGNPDKSEWVANSGLTNEIKNAYDAWIAAGAAELKVAKIIENSEGMIVTSGINGGAVTPGTTSTYGYNTLMAPNYLGLRYNAINLAKLTTTESTPALEFYVPSVNSGGTPVQGNKGLSISATALTFYNPSSNAAQLIIGANGTLQSGNYTRGSDSKFSSNGTKIDLINGDIITKYFRVSQGLESGLNAGVYVHGTIEALDGTIGTDSTNYWEIGNSIDYNLNSTAKMVGHGSSYIQLGDSSTWRLSTNRIHTAWYTSSDSLLHFPAISSKYWDFGVHTPDSATDKFLYIRSSKSNTSASSILQNLLYDINDSYATPQWDYKFYIDGSGNLYAANLYFFDENGNAVQVGGADGAYLPKTGGTITGNLEVNGTLTKSGKNVAYLTTTPTSGQILIADGTSGGIKTSGYTIAKSVPSNAIFTDENVKSTEANTTKLWLVGSDTSGTRTGTLKYDSGVYITTTAGTVHATTFEGNLSGTASRATADADGNTIKTTYLKLSGGNVTGAVTFGSSVSIDELTAGDLVVNGNASFTNNAQFNTINGVAVGSNPKFTDTVTTVTVTGNGNAVTSASASNGAVTLTKGATFLTSYTETDPIFKASAAYGISSTDISNWNSKTSNTGTVTSVAASGSGGITISGSPITTSGTITIGLNLSTAINGLGEGTSNATRNDYIVAQYAGGGTTTTTYHRRSLAHIFAALNSSDITTALGYTPYNSTNPNGYITANHTSTYNLPIAKYSTLGGVKPAYSSTGAASLTTAAATNTTTPTIAAKTTTSGRYYAIEIDKNGVLFVNVPWTNVNSSYLTSSSTLNWNNVTQNRPTTASGYGITDAITNVSATSASGGSTTFTLTKSNGTTSSFDVVVYASAATQATDANYLTDGTTRYSVGSAKKPIYFDGGIPKASDGTEGTSTKPVYLSSGTITAGSTYAGGTKVTLNNSDKGASTASFYAPTTGGTTSQVLIGNGTTSAPVWTNISSLVPSSATNATNDSDGNPINTTYLKKSGGTMNGTAVISWADSGSWGTSGATFPLKRGGLYWSGTSDWIDLFAEETASDKLNLVINFGDDTNPSLVLRDRGTDTITLTPGTGTITATTFSGALSGNATSATTATTASKLGSSTVGSVRQAIYLSGGTATAGNYTVAHLGNANKSNMNDVGRLHASVGMTNLADPSNNTDNPMNGTTKSTSWHLYWNANYTDDPSGSNAWVAQIVNKAGTAQWWVRSRSGGTITNGTAWAADWKHLVVAPQAGQGSATVPIYIDANGHTQSITSYSGKAATAGTADNATNATYATYDASETGTTKTTIANKYLQLSGGTMSGNITMGSSSGIVYYNPSQFMRWTNSTTDNNSTGRSWYGIGTYTNADDNNYSWFNISNYWGINITTRGNTNLRHNNSIIPHTNNTSGTVGSATQPVYISGGVITAGTALGGAAYQATDYYIKKAGDSMTGGLAINASNSYSSYNEGLRINAGARTYATLTIGGTNNSTDGISDGAFWIGVYNTGSYARRLMIAHNASTQTNTYFYSNASGTVSPWLHLGNSGTITSGNSDAVTGGVVYTAISNLSGTYVGLTGNEGILGTKVFGSGTSYGSVTSKTSYTEKANINYNATLDALVFSFA